MKLQARLSSGPYLGLVTGDAWLTVCFTRSVSSKLSLGLWGWVEPGHQLVRILSFVNVNKFGWRSDQLKCYLRNVFLECQHMLVEQSSDFAQSVPVCMSIDWLVDYSDVAWPSPIFLQLQSPLNLLSPTRDKKIIIIYRFWSSLH